MRGFFPFTSAQRLVCVCLIVMLCAINLQIRYGARNASFEPPQPDDRDPAMLMLWDMHLDPLAPDAEAFAVDRDQGEWRMDGAYLTHPPATSLMTPDGYLMISADGPVIRMNRYALCREVVQTVQELDNSGICAFSILREDIAKVPHHDTIQQPVFGIRWMRMGPHDFANAIRIIT